MLSRPTAAETSAIRAPAPNVRRWGCRKTPRAKTNRAYDAINSLPVKQDEKKGVRIALSAVQMSGFSIGLGNPGFPTASLYVIAMYESKARKIFRGTIRVLGVFLGVFFYLVWCVDIYGTGIWHTPGKDYRWHRLDRGSVVYFLQYYWERIVATKTAKRWDMALRMTNYKKAIKFGNVIQFW